MAVGLYGAVSVAKYHERADYHLTQARALTRTLVQAGSLPDADTALENARQAHYNQYPRLSRIRRRHQPSGARVKDRFTPGFARLARLRSGRRRQAQTGSDLAVSRRPGGQPTRRQSRFSFLALPRQTRISGRNAHFQE
jgi:hypothetical protein